MLLNYIGYIHILASTITMLLAHYPITDRIYDFYTKRGRGEFLMAR